MAERDIMDYNFFTKCVFISSTHIIFDFTIRRNMTEIICEGNLIINIHMDANVEIFTDAENNSIVKSEMPKIVERCKEKAHWIFFNKN